jgi:hypothetical protein
MQQIRKLRGIWSRSNRSQREMLLIAAFVIFSAIFTAQYWIVAVFFTSLLATMAFRSARRRK